MTDQEARRESAQVPAGERIPRGRSVGKAQLVNRLNFINFQDQTVLVSLRHLAYDSSVTLRARPLPCAGERLDCRWAEEAGVGAVLTTYGFEFLLIPDGRKYLVVNSELVTLDEEGFSLVLPVTCREFEARRIKRHAGVDVEVEMIQNAALLKGELDDFTPVSVRISGATLSPATLQWFNPERELNLRLARNGAIVHSGPFEMVSQRVDGDSSTLVLRQLTHAIQRFKPRRYRTNRQQLVPSPNIVFNHPLIDKRVNLKVLDISGTGLGVEESEGESVLMAGLILPGVRLVFGPGFSLELTAQVVSRNPQGDGTVRCGLVILDMDVKDHVKILSLLHQAADRKSYVCTEVDLNDLWDFFFETGFIYPGKYAHFQANKEEIKRLYAKLYRDNPQIARHFINLDRGAILGHLAMVRLYRDSWMIHHHAARKSMVRAGLAVLERVGEYLNELDNFAFAHLRFVYCYYRPDNKFPRRVFGGYAAQETDRNACSEDRFAYFHFRPSGSGPEALPSPWDLAESSRFDLTEVASFYRFRSGGLLTEAFDLNPGVAFDDDLEREYRALGFAKDKLYYSLRKEGALKAFFLVNRTDAGFNMAELTNCVTAMVLDDDVPATLVTAALEIISRGYEAGGMPVLAYPESWVQKAQVPAEKSYLLWILNLQYTDHYFEFCETLFSSPAKGRPGSGER
ncbi:PilZ domain-containing protein [Geomonas sp. Red32]|uniref:PilZ domain-containing protein n=1 Tax=Geomonas sp. Red32 TaxID=2912856 RepID=UPI00202D0223|nr:PilZ domain-containing protein [Geomonas sp. Red32]